MSFFDIFMKSPNSEKLIFVEPWDQKKWIAHSIYNQNHSVLGKKFFHKHVFKNK